jgi:predicted dehydrogenase
MKRTDRREFLHAAGAAVTAFCAAPSAVAAGASDRIVMALIGPGGMGSTLLRSFMGMEGVTFKYVCDPDERHRDEARRAVDSATGTAPRAVPDMRVVFDDKDVEAVVIATPDHWHGPATILALDAGKHVYVEKPCAHNIREGRLMIEAARRAGRVVQVGTQSRSTEHVMRAVQRLREGAIGEVLVAKAWNSQLRRSIGHAKPSKPPAYLDFDLWLGPAPDVPYQPNLLHSIWRWWYAFGSGDIGNDGVHDIDIARWGLGVETHPNRVAALGGKYFFDDDQQFPDTQYVVYEYSGGRKKQLVFEQRIWSPYVQEGHENGNAFYGTEGMMVLGKKAGWKLYGPRNELREEMSGGVDGASHHRDFLRCVRSGKRPHADIEIGHLSAALCHLGNIATRVGRQLEFDPARERIAGDEEAGAMVRRTYREGHWAVPAGV